VWCVPLLYSPSMGNGYGAVTGQLPLIRDTILLQEDQCLYRVRPTSYSWELR